MLCPRSGGNFLAKKIRVAGNPVHVTCTCAIFTPFSVPYMLIHSFTSVLLLLVGDHNVVSVSENLHSSSCGACECLTLAHPTSTTTVSGILNSYIFELNLLALIASNSSL